MIGQTQRPNELRFVLFEEEGGWIAICLEHYIGAQGKDPEEVKQRLKGAYRAELEESRTRTGTAFRRDWASSQTVPGNVGFGLSARGVSTKNPLNWNLLRNGGLSLSAVSNLR